MLRSVISQKILLFTTAIVGLIWGWNSVHWQAAGLINTPPKEAARWNYPNLPCKGIVGYFHGRPYSSSTYEELKENGLLLQTCWSELQQQGSRGLLINAAGTLIPSEYSTANNDPIGLVQQFFPSLILPGNISPDDPEALFTKLSSRLSEGNNTEQIRALRYSCQNPQLAQAVKETTKASTLTATTRSWYVMEMLEHCSQNVMQRKQYMKEQWDKYPQAHGFLMLEWHLYHGDLPDQFKPTSDPLEQSVFAYLSAMSNTTTH